MEKVLDVLFPPRCFGCWDGYGHICHKCLLECKIARHFYCVVCDKPSVLGETHELCQTEESPVCIFSAFEYKGLVRDCIMQAKYKAMLFAPLKVVAKEAADLASKCDMKFDHHIVVPIPLSVKRNRERGFNQAGIIARQMAERFSLAYQDSILVRSKETIAQHEKTRQARFANMRNAFSTRRDLNGKRVLVVDDICTTGATLLEASKALYQAGATEVRCFTLAKEF